MWNTAANTLVEGNTFINCQREIAFGLIERTPNDHTGGIIRNNFIYRAANTGGDTPIGVFDSPGTSVLHNTIFLSGDYSSSIEYRWTNTTGVIVANNLADAPIRARDGGRPRCKATTPARPAATLSILRPGICTLRWRRRTPSIEERQSRTVRSTGTASQGRSARPRTSAQTSSVGLDDAAGAGGTDERARRTLKAGQSLAAAGIGTCRGELRRSACRRSQCSRTHTAHRACQ